MKKTFIISLLLITVFSITACNKQTTKQSQTEKRNLTKDGFRRPDFGQPEERPNVNGLVKNIIGNEVTVLKITRPNRENMEEGGETIETDEKEQDNNERTKTNLTRTFSGGSGTRGGMGMRGGTRPEMSDENRAAMMEKMESMSSGEEKVVIPIGIRMLKISDGEPVEANLGDIKQNSMLMIWTDQTITDRNIATFVMIK